MLRLLTAALFSLLLLRPAAALNTGPDESALGSILHANTQDQTVHGGAVTPSNCALGQGFPTCTVSANITVTIDCGLGPLQTLENNSAFTLKPPVNDGSCDVLVQNGASAGTITFSGWNVGSNTGDTYATTNGNYYTLFVRRLTAPGGSKAGYFWGAHQ